MWFHPETARLLSAALGIPASRLADALGDDIRQTWVGNNYAMEGIVHEHEGETHTDAWGIEWVREGFFNQVRRSPLKDAGEETLAAYRFPFGEVEQLLTTMEGVAARSGEHFLGCDISPCLLELLFRIRGMEETLFDAAAEPLRTERMLRDAAQFAVTLGTRACERYRLDWLWTGDDVGGQQAMILSPALWRKLVKPRLAEIFAVGKTRGLPVAYHCCGTLRPIIPDLVAMGLDVLNPIQPNCPGMNPAELKREFGSTLAFMGGVDTQELLPRGTRNQVYAETKELLDIMTAGGGGYILAASHAIPPETPLENIFALYEAAGIPQSEIFDRASTIRASLPPPIS
jgi:uroporphyrinogen decarboxylase